MGDTIDKICWRSAAGKIGVTQDRRQVVCVGESDRLGGHLSAGRWSFI